MNYNLVKFFYNWSILFIALIFFVLKAIYIPPYLEDWDSILFAQAIDNYSLVDQQPHAPGYPIYIIIAKLINSIIQNKTYSLALISVFLGSIMAIPFYLLALKFSNIFTALIVFLLLLVTPLSLTLSQVALSNIPGTAFMLITAYLLYQGKTSKHFLLLGCFLAGFTLGVRFAEYSMVLPLILLVLYFRNWKNWFAAILFFVFGISLWLIPLIIITGLNEFIAVYTKQATYITTHDSLLAESTSLRFRLDRLHQLFTWGFTNYFFVFIGIIIFCFIFRLKQLTKYDQLFLLVWLISYLLPLTLLYNLEVTRYLLPLLPPLCLLLASALYKLKSRILYLISCILLVGIFLEGLDQIQQLKKLIPPTIAPVFYIQENFNPNNTTLITSFTYKQFQYYLPEFTNYYGVESVKDKEIQTEFLVTDYKDLKNQLSNLNDYEIIDHKNYVEPEKIFPRVSQTNLYIYRK